MFAGTVIRMTVEGGSNVAVISVTRVYKGEPWAMQKVWPGGGQDDSGGQWATSCDARLSYGQAYLFVANGGHVDICSVYGADEDWIAEELGAGEPPDPDLIPSSLQPQETETAIPEAAESPEEGAPPGVAAELPVEGGGGFPSWAISLIVVAAVFGGMAGVAITRARSLK